MSDPWYNKYWRDKECSEFRDWFLRWYGVPEDYPEDDPEEYWLRRGFALAGWKAAGFTEGYAQAKKDLALDEFDPQATPIEEELTKLAKEIPQKEWEQSKWS